jgi:thiol-disulfide isomerase/thioredoxin
LRYPIGVIFALFIFFSTQAFAEKAPDFSLKGRSGQIRLSAFKGRVVYLDFWASWCVPCRKSFPWMNEIEKRFGPKGLTVVAINIDKGGASAEAFLEDYPPIFKVAFDASGKVAESYGVWTMPSSYLIDQNGNLRFSHKGFFDGAKESIVTEIQGLLAK